MKKFFKILMWSIVALLFAGTFVYLWINSRGEKTVYDTVRPTIGSLSRSTLLTGSIEPRDEIAIKPQISGIIAEIMVEAGDVVHEGDVVARIKVIPEEGQLSSAENRVKVALQNLDLIRSKHERTAALWEKKYVSREEFEESENSLRNAELEVEAAKDALSIVRDGVSASNAQQSNTLVRATITGLVLDVPVKVGSSVIQANTFNDGTTIASVADMNDLIFRGKVDETDVGSLSIGMPVEITIGALHDVTLGASIEYISPKAVNENGANTFEIKAAVAVPDSLTVRSGYSANASVVLNRADSVVTVPEGVLEFEGNDAYVYILSDSVAEQKFDRRKVTTGLSDGINVEVKQGVDTTMMIRGYELKKK
ncbi:MAG: efflux RND transporter periplasmic adaptor subunit [Muribaculaceae bacterium]|nr:efflux RND transporter periplasmic adaptor subunit [Muribaculaceae bacterium]